AGARAEVVAACTVNALAAGGLVAAVGRRGVAGRAAAAAVALAVAGLGALVMWNPWPPNVVVLPLSLLGVLALGALRGSLPAAAAALPVAGFVVQADVGTAPLAVPLLGLAAYGAGRRLLRRPAPGTATRAGWPTVAGGTAAVLVAAGVAMWIPPLVDQARGSGNLGHVVAFFLSPHRHAGLAAGASMVGRDQASLVGLRLPTSPVPTGWGAAGLGLVVALSAVGLGRGSSRSWARQLAVLALGGTAIAVVAGAEVVGPSYGYLLGWSLAPVVWALAAALDALTSPGMVRRDVRRPRRRTVAWLAPLALGLGLAGMLARAVLEPDIGTFSAVPVARGWSLVRPAVGRAAVVGVHTGGPGAWGLAAGLADELDGSGRGYRVTGTMAEQYPPGQVGPATVWITLLPVGSVPPVGERLLGVAGAWEVVLGR
ncbi:MAG TPA: hypothetical protein VFH45_02325, partial [Acidimicrobiales bacterium]|nr:hypothetical protein [Acidimicrobiales bacterium]